MRIIVKTKLDVIKLKRHIDVSWLDKHTLRYVLASDFIVTLGQETLVIPAGYITDLASIPRYLWWLFNPEKLPWSFRASVMHDYMYSHCTERFTKKFSDEVFFRMLIKDDAPKFLALLFYSAVVVFGVGKWT